LRTDYFILETPKEQLYTDSEYQTFRQQVLKRENYLCEYCEKKATHVHHSRPQKLEGHKDECSTYNLATKICDSSYQLKV